MGNYAGLEIRFANLASPSLFISHSFCLCFSDFSLSFSLSAVAPPPLFLSGCRMWYVQWLKNDSVCFIQFLESRHCRLVLPVYMCVLGVSVVPLLKAQKMIHINKVVGFLLHPLHPPSTPQTLCFTSVIACFFSVWGRVPGSLWQGTAGQWNPMFLCEWTLRQLLSEISHEPAKLEALLHVCVCVCECAFFLTLWGTRVIILFGKRCPHFVKGQLLTWDYELLSSCLSKLDFWQQSSFLPGSHFFKAHLRKVNF